MDYDIDFNSTLVLSVTIYEIKIYLEILKRFRSVIADVNILNCMQKYII